MLLIKVLGSDVFDVVTLLPPPLPSSLPLGKSFTKKNIYILPKEMINFGHHIP